MSAASIPLSRYSSANNEAASHELPALVCNVANGLPVQDDLRRNSLKLSSQVFGKWEFIDIWPMLADSNHEKIS